MRDGSSPKLKIAAEKVYNNSFVSLLIFSSYVAT